MNQTVTNTIYCLSGSQQSQTRHFSANSFLFQKYVQVCQTLQRLPWAIPMIPFWRRQSLQCDFLELKLLILCSPLICYQSISMTDYLKPCIIQSLEKKSMTVTLICILQSRQQPLQGILHIRFLDIYISFYLFIFKMLIGLAYLLLKLDFVFKIQYFHDMVLLNKRSRQILGDSQSYCALSTPFKVKKNL